MSDFYRFMAANWEQVGVAPILLELLMCDFGWTPDEIDICFEALMGKHYAMTKGSVWVEKLEYWGYEFPEGTPVLEVLDLVLMDYWNKAPGHPFIH